MRLRSRNPVALAGLDAIDNGIVEILRENGRASNQEIAERLSVTPATISARLKRLEDTKALRVVAVTDFSAHDLNILIAVGVKVQDRDARDVGMDLAKLPEVFAINVMNGVNDLELLVTLSRFEDISTFLIEHVAPIPGVSQLDPGIAADIVKFEFHVAPL
jgi:Lrp/AsnC family transcriptional regulator for asnA, asnC and gidA